MEGLDMLVVPFVSLLFQERHVMPKKINQMRSGSSQSSPLLSGYSSNVSKNADLSIADASKHIT
jgi:hypothetical protein